jgi:SNF2 family DNA or RNA helicase
MTAAQTALYQQTLKVAMAEVEGIESTDHQSLFKRQGLVLQMILALKQICNHPSQFLKNGRYEASLSGKAELLLDLTETILERNEKVLIFTQFKEMGNILVRIIEEQSSEKPMFYPGGCNQKERQDMVDRFQNNRADKVFVLSLKAAAQV